MRPLAVLRPEPGASATVEKARAAGLDAFAVPLFIIEPVDWSVPAASDFDALLVTSANAVRCAGQRLRSLDALPVYAGGPATAEAAREAGLTVTGSGPAGIDALLETVPGELRLLHLCGVNRKQPAAMAHRITQLPVYRSSAVPNPVGIERVAGAVALVHSPRAGRRLAELAIESERTAIAAISPAAASACGAGWEEIAIADCPRDDVLLSLGARLCEQSQPQ